jgi:hypothetical protein
MFYFYINFPNFKERVIIMHKADCGMCRNGKGQNGPEYSNERGFWAGPFEKYPDTVLALEKLISKFNTKVNFDNCRFCNPDK